MIFVDSNIPMYLVGAPHPNKTCARMILERHIVARDRLVTDVEVFQEILHRYVAIDRRDAIQPAFDSLAGVVDEVLAIEFADVERAKAVVHDKDELSARDAIHVAVMDRHGIDRIMSFDRAFDLVPGLTRIAT
ncbi:MAG: type II toxin-antitoxin system VapC family toxin [Gemmatimonadales bacterium]